MWISVLVMASGARCRHCAKPTDTHRNGFGPRCHCTPPISPLLGSSQHCVPCLTMRLSFRAGRETVWLQGMHVVCRINTFTHNPFALCKHQPPCLHNNTTLSPHCPLCLVTLVSMCLCCVSRRCHSRLKWSKKKVNDTWTFVSMSMLNVCGDSIHSWSKTMVVKDNWTDDVLEDKRTRRQESDTQHNTKRLLSQFR